MKNIDYAIIRNFYIVLYIMKIIDIEYLKVLVRVYSQLQFIFIPSHSFK